MLLLKYQYANFGKDILQPSADRISDTVRLKRFFGMPKNTGFLVLQNSKYQKTRKRRKIGKTDLKMAIQRSSVRREQHMTHHTAGRAMHLRGLTTSNQGSIYLFKLQVFWF